MVQGLPHLEGGSVGGLPREGYSMGGLLRQGYSMDGPWFSKPLRVCVSFVSVQISTACTTIHPDYWPFSPLNSFKADLFARSPPSLNLFHRLNLSQL